MAPSFEPDNRSAYLHRVIAALDEFVLGENADPMTRHDEWIGALERPLPDEGIGGSGVIDELVRHVIPNGARINEAGFWGWITTQPTAVATAASLGATVASPQRYTLTAFNFLEELSLDWLGQLCGLASNMKGVYSSGGSVANLVALGAARQWAFEQLGIDAAATGWGSTSTSIYTSVESHHTILRSAGVLGLGRRNVRLIACDAQQRLDPRALAQALEDDQNRGVVPLAIVATAGTTNTGAIDPLRECGELARRYGAWFHVDGAYGLPGILDERVRPLYDGLELADSVIVDPHKWLGAPTGIAATFVRDRSILHRAFTQEPANYLEGSFSDPDDARSSLESMGIPYADFGVELSSPARGVVVWSLLRELGRSGVAQRIRRDNDFARQLAAAVRRHDHLELLSEPVLSICCFRYRRGGVDDLDALNQQLHRRLLRETPYLPSTTVVNGSFGMRPCFINSRTSSEDVDGLADAVARLGDELSSSLPSGSSQ